MKVAYQLRWLPQSAAATALLLPGHRADEVLRVCVELGADPLPPVYAVADGFLLLLAAPSQLQIVGATRLRGLSKHLLIPVNAELVPALLPDESEALVRKRGLVFLPGARVLEFDPERPIALSSLVQVGPAEHRPWRALPAPPELAQNITEITQVGVDTTAEQIIEQGGEGIATEDPTLEEGGLPSQIAGNAIFQLGKSLAWLGQKMNSAKLAGLGAKLLGGAMSLVPSLSEKLMGAQEAMLRELLRQFRAGNIDNALRHAMPLNADPTRGMTPAQNARLPTHNLFYSLLNLLGSGGGRASLWMSSDETYYELLREYRKQADLAVSRGDFRRAAFIHGKLLHDFHSAAKVLAQGGLHRDAAILYEKKLGDLVWAAKEWEASGEVDRAIHLYRKMADHASAGDLLRRIGEEDRAVTEYQLAAAKLVESGPKHYEAGELLRVRAQRPDLARDYYEKGWRLRPAGSALLCATRLVQQHAEAPEAEPFLSVLTEAEEYLAGNDPESTAIFFTEVARLAKTPPLAPISDDVFDRALLGIARKMKQNLTMSPSYARSLANMVKNPSVWPVPLVGDAQNALNEASKRPLRARTEFPSVRAGRSNVTAVCQMPPGHQVFLGFENGDVACFEPASNAVHLLTRESGPILSLVVDASKTYLLILSQMSQDKVCVRAVSRAVGYRMIAYHHESVSAPARLAVPALNSHAKYTLLYHGNDYRYFTLPNLVGLHSFHMGRPDDVAEVVVHGTFDQRQSTWWVLAIVDGRVRLLPDKRPNANGEAALGWLPGISEASTLMQVPLQAVLLDTRTLEVAGLDMHGSLCRAILRFQGGGADVVHFYPIGGDRYRAFACVRGDLMAGVHVKGIDWWTPARVRPVQTKLTLKNPVAAFALPEARELLIVEADGLLTRVPAAE